MKILVCMSNVPDTTTKVKLSGDKKSVDMAGVQWIINPWDELALSRAIDLKEKNPGVIESITVLTVGKSDCEPTIRKALAMGADKGIRVDAEAEDSYFTAAQIASVVKSQPHEVIICGIESSDFNGGSTGGMLAEFLDIASVSSVSHLDIEGGKVMVNREIDGGYEKVETSLPFVAIVQKGIAIEPKIPTMRGIMTARTKAVETVAPAPVGCLTTVKGYELPPVKAACKLIPAEEVKQLAELLKNEARVI